MLEVSVVRKIKAFSEFGTHLANYSQAKDGRMQTKDAEQVLELLNAPVPLDLRLDELRIIITCMRAIEYQTEVDDEPYLDEDGYALKRRLEQLYRVKLRKLESAQKAG